jgi:tetratricopeptide (TPR) repeat protein
VTYVRIASILNTTGKHERAIETLRKAVEDQEFVAQRFPDVLVYQVAVAQTLSNLAEAQVNFGDHRAALQSIERAIQYANRSNSQGRKFPLLDRLRERRQILLNPPAEPPTDASANPASESPDNQRASRPAEPPSVPE